MSRADYRPFVPAPGKSPIAGDTPRAHAEARLQRPRAQDLFGTWKKLGEAPFRGVTTDGHARPGLFSLRPEDAPTAFRNDLAAVFSKVSNRGLTLILLANSDALTAPFGLEAGDVTASIFARTFLRIFIP